MRGLTGLIGTGGRVRVISGLPGFVRFMSNLVFGNISLGFLVLLGEFGTLDFELLPTQFNHEIKILADGRLKYQL